MALTSQYLQTDVGIIGIPSPTVIRSNRRSTARDVQYVAYLLRLTLLAGKDGGGDGGLAKDTKVHTFDLNHCGYVYRTHNMYQQVR